MTGSASRPGRFAARLAFYLAVQLGLLAMAVLHAFDTPSFIYQAF